MTDPTAAFAKLVPGFDFLQGLVKNAGAAIPGVGHWVAPTLDPEEIEQRIKELRTVQFWLEQNARMTASTIQALEVQRMTLSTLKTMNVSLGDLTEALKIRPAPGEADGDDEMPSPYASFGMRKPAPTPDDAAAASASAAQAKSPARSTKSKGAKAPQVPAGVVDPMQWWGALTQQFAEIATNTLKDSAAEAARQMAGAMVKQGMDAAGDTLNKAAAMPSQVAQSMASNATQAARQMAAVAGKAAGTAAGMAKAASQAAPAKKRSAAAGRKTTSASRARKR